MNRKNSVKAIIVLVVALILTVPIVSSTTVLFFGDIQISCNSANPTRDFPGTVQDVWENVSTIVSNNYSFNYAWALGDLLSYSECTPGDTDEIHDLWEIFYSNWSKINASIGNKKNSLLIGNHDDCWGIDNNYIQRGYERYYNYTFGNIFVIVLSDLDTPGYSTGGSSGEGQLVYGGIDLIDYCDKAVRANQDKNIFILTHQAVCPTTVRSCSSSNQLEPQADITAMFQDFQTDGIHVDACIHGHTHCGYPDDELIVEKYGTTFIDASAAGSGSCDESQFFTGHVMFMNLTDGSDTARLDMLDITNYVDPTDWVDWSDTYGTQTYPRDLTLTYAFDDGTIQFVDISAGANGTTFTDTTPTFNWSTEAGAVKYQLQVATDSGFTNLVVDLKDINEFIYPTEYSVSGSTVSFTLPASEALTSRQDYYFRVRAFT